ncbi:hypothetical protein HKX48_008706 [Thoreauomyces humboldtii]|nr:hypothetical protein HKX48_008706 [Thoreauomyces humboldtii]
MALSSETGITTVLNATDPTVLLSGQTQGLSPAETNFAASFGSQAGISFVLKGANGANAVNKDYLDAVFQLQDSLMAAQIVHDGRTFGVLDFCLQTISKSGNLSCYMTSPVAAWASREALNADSRMERTLSTVVSAGCGSLNYLSSFLGGMEYRSAEGPQIVQSAKALRFRLGMWAAYDSLEEAALPAMLREMSRLMGEGDVAGQHAQPAYRIMFVTSDEPVKELQYAVVEGAWLLLGGVLLMFVYISLSLRGPTMVRSSSTLALLCIFNAILAMAGGIGVASAGGAQLHPLTIQVMPFLIFGLGIDSLFLLARRFDSECGASAEIRLRATFQSIGHAQITTTAEISLGLLAGAIVPGITRSMCIMSALAIIINTFLMLTSAAATIVLLDRKDGDARSSTGFAAGSEQRRPDALLRRFYSLLIGSRLARRLIIGSFVMLTVLSPLGITRITEDLNLLDFVTKSGSAAATLNLDKDFGGTTKGFEVFLPAIDQLSSDAQQHGLELLDALTDLPNVSGTPIHWLPNFNTWIRTVSPHSHELVGKEVPADKMSSWVREFLNDTKHGGNCLRPTILWTGDEITGSVMLGDYVPENTLADYAPSVLAVRNVVSQGVNLSAFEMGTYDSVALSFIHMRTDILVMFGTFLAGTVVMNALFFRKARVTLLTIPILVSAMLAVCAVLPGMGIPINSIIVAILGVSMAIATDFSGYVQEAHLAATQTTPGIRVSRCSDSSFQTVDRCESTIATPGSWCLPTVVSLTYSTIGALLSLMPLAFSQLPIISDVFVPIFAFAIAASWYLCLLVYPVLLDMVLPPPGHPLPETVGCLGDAGKEREACVV